MKNEQELLSLFCDPKMENKVRHYAKPWRNDGYVIATDGYIMFRFKIENSDNAEAYEEIRKPFDAKEADCNLRLKKSDIRETLRSLGDTEAEPEPMECEDCEGLGYVEWNYEAQDGSNYEMLGTCPVCDGKCVITPEERIVLVAINAGNIGHGRPWYRHFYFQKILAAMDMLGLDEARIVHIRQNEACHIILDEAIGAEIFLMPFVTDYQGVVKEIKTEKI